MQLEEFRSDFLAETAAWAAAGNTFRHFSFVELAVDYLSEAGEVADFESCYYRGSGRRNRTLAIDGYAFDLADGSLRVFLADPSFSEETESLTRTEAAALFERLRWLVEEILDGGLIDDLEMSAPAYDFAASLMEKRDDVSRVRAYLLSDKLLSTRARDWKEGEAAGRPVEFHIWDIERFHRIQTSRTRRDDLVVDFSGLDGGGLRALNAGRVNDEYEAYLCVVPGQALADIYAEHGSRLLEGNVRSFLTTRGRINKGIRNTIQHEPSMFFAFNNGIAATASAIDLRETGDGHRIVSATDLQIVNGGQTTASLTAAQIDVKAALGDVFVPMKLSVVTPERSETLIPRISRYANSQNRVSEADFFSNHPFHLRIEEISRRLWVPARTGSQHETHWFYERVRGQYMNATFGSGAAQKRRFQQLNPRDQVLTKTDLAKAENSWRRLPHMVSLGAQKNFLHFAGYVSGRWDDDDSVFNEAYFRAVVAHIILFRATERLVSAQPWYAGGYRANVVTYAMAALSSAIQKDSRGLALDVGALWSTQTLSPALERQVVEFAGAVHDVIVAPPAGTKNVTEWAKREACWKEVQKLDLRLATYAIDDLADARHAEQAQKAAKSQQKQDSGIDAQKRVVELGQDYWANTRQWALSKGYLTPTESSVILNASNFANGIPTDFQCKKLLQLKERLEVEGLAPPPDEV